jgi:hypothetical protein
MIPGGPMDHHHGAGHQHQKAVHSLLCSWACQASSSAFIFQSLAQPLLLLSIATLAAFFPACSPSRTGTAECRAPPDSRSSR